MNRNKKILIICIFSILILSCIFTNPNKNEYINWTMESMQYKSTDILEKGLIGILGKRLITDTTMSKNYILFSVYRTKIDDQEIVTVGAFKNFFCVKNKIKNENITKGAFKN